jgi:tetratricopeptide (TPR) repeat protein
MQFPSDVRKRFGIVPAFVCLIALVACSGRTQIPGEEELKSYAKAAALYAEGRFSETITQAAALIQKRPGFGPALVLQGKSYLFMGEPEKAIKVLDKAAKNPVANREAGIWLARALRASGDAKKAERALEGLLSSDSDDWRILYFSASMRRDSGDAAGSVAFLDRSIEAASGIGLAYIDRARIRYTAGDVVGAMEDVNAALAVLPTGSASRAAAESIANELAKSSSAALGNNDGKAKP